MLCRRTDECAVCLTKMRFGYVTLHPCGHKFHKQCIRKHAHTRCEMNDSCPLCRGRMSTGTLHLLIRNGPCDKILSLRYSHDLTVSGRCGRHDYVGCAWGSLLSEVLERGRSQGLKRLALNEYAKMGCHVTETEDDAQIVSILQNTFEPQHWKAAYDECVDGPPFVLHSISCAPDDMDETLHISMQRLEEWDKEISHNASSR